MIIPMNQYASDLCPFCNPHLPLEHIFEARLCGKHAKEQYGKIKSDLDKLIEENKECTYEKEG